MEAVETRTVACDRSWIFDVWLIGLLSGFVIGTVVGWRLHWCLRARPREPGHGDLRVQGPVTYRKSRFQPLGDKDWGAWDE